MKEFSALTQEKLKYYVYILKDPMDYEVFYVGKGIGNRIFSHVNDALETSVVTDKLEHIRAIHSRKDEVLYYIHRHGMTESEALLVEAALIDVFGLEDLKNEVRGHHTQFGPASAQELEIRYAAQPIVIDDPVFLGFCTRYDPELTSSEELFHDTSYCWKVVPKKHPAKYAFAVHKMIIREVYEIEEWLRDPMNHRWYFTGQVAPDDIRGKYMYKDISSYIVGTTICKKGKRTGQVIPTVNQNLKWVNC